MTKGEASGWPVAGKEIGLLFCDISSFTSSAEGQLAYDHVHSLNRFFKLLGDPIRGNHGSSTNTLATACSRSSAWKSARTKSAHDKPSARACGC